MDTRTTRHRPQITNYPHRALGDLSRTLNPASRTPVRLEVIRTTVPHRGVKAVWPGRLTTGRSRCRRGNYVVDIFLHSPAAFGFRGFLKNSCQYYQPDGKARKRRKSDPRPAFTIASKITAQTLTPYLTQLRELLLRSTLSMPLADKGIVSATASST
ncbi:hypothetical protein GE21DRAFT_1290946 [Neurospora crassa]|nr:hypothetical protein GE21DRAFT_1290946 [Neurospora crassa]